MTGEPLHRYPFSKAISGGRPISDDEIRQLTQDQLRALKEQVANPPIEKTDNELTLRLAQEIEYSRRLLEQVEAELNRRRLSPEQTQIVQQIGKAEEILADLAPIIEAKNPCEAIDKGRSPELRNRLLRKNVDGSGGVCSERPARPSRIRRTSDQERS